MSSEMKSVKGGFLGGGTEHPPEPENLQCPRCESTNTKFCYYNNYNLSQPRYFCKSCRRYWTRGGSLRNVPVGGGSRKNSKRLRPSLSSSATSSPLPPPILSAEIKAEQTPTPPPPPPTLSPFRCEMNLNESLPVSFSSLLGAGGFLGLSGYGIGLGPDPGPSHHTSSAFDMLGLGFGKDWPAIVTGTGGGSSGGSSSGCNTWPLETGPLTDGSDCFGWPDLAISTPGTAGLE